MSHRNAIRRDEQELARLDADQEALDGWAVNYLRHALSLYEDGLGALVGRVGRAEATDAWRAQVYAAITGAYPTLASECAKQRARRAPW